jgi:hypothetical protein
MRYHDHATSHSARRLSHHSSSKVNFRHTTCALVGATLIVLTPMAASGADSLNSFGNPPFGQRMPAKSVVLSIQHSGTYPFIDTLCAVAISAEGTVSLHYSYQRQVVGERTIERDQDQAFALIQRLIGIGFLSMGSSYGLQERIMKYRDNVVLERSKETDAPCTSVVLQLGDYEKAVSYVPRNAPDSLEAVVDEAERWATNQ